VVSGPSPERPAGRRRSVVVPEGLEGERVDTAVARLFGVSRTQAADLVASGSVQVDGVPPVKSERLVAGSALDVDLPPPPGVAPPEAKPVDGLVVVYDDDDLVVVDKPVGVAAHPSPGWTGPTVVGGLAGAGYRVSTSGPAERQGVVHRLDVGTSGLMVVAKSETAYTSLKRAFKERTVDKVYHALVQGHPDPSRGTIDAPIGRHPSNDWKWAVVGSGKDSVTHYETLEAFPAASLLKVDLETGRTHQIRVHMSAVRHPCVGDLTYGADPTLSRRLGLDRQWLHARELSFDHPRTGERLQLRSRYPADLEHALDVLRAESHPT
jgi:23S rRNA pseudouridine1911/1915/1917 synthase